MEHLYELSRDSVSRALAWYKANDDCPSHFHSSIEIVCLLRGEMTAVLEGISYTVKADTLIVNSCYDMHAYHSSGESSEIVATIPLNVLPAFSGLLSHKRFAKRIIPFCSGTPYEQLLRMMADPGSHGNEAYINSLAQALVALLAEQVGLTQRENSSEDDWLRRVLSYIQQNAFLPLTVEKAASVFGYSPGRFSHRFTQQVGISFLQYLQRLRCEQARIDLREGKLSIREISSKCGFSSLRTFHRVYKTHTGQTPLQTREMR